jgi:VWFA-related protein
VIEVWACRRIVCRGLGAGAAAGLAVVLCLAGPLAQPAQGQRGTPAPRMTLPEVPQPDRQQTPFRTAVTRVEVSALVLDQHDAPVRGLTAADFEVLENGVPQAIRSFAPFTYESDLIELPDPVLEPGNPSPPAAAAPASNYYAEASRVFTLILDDLHVDARRTQAARAAARRLVERLTPADLLLVVTTAAGESTGYFTRERQQALHLVDRFTGQRLPDRTIARMRFGGHDFEQERLDHYERLCATIRNVAAALRDVSGRRKTVILISEGSSFGAGMSDMTVRMPTATGGGRVGPPTGSLRAMNDALAAAAAGDVAIYPLNPAGLDVPDADLILAPGLVREEMSGPLYAEILTEARQAKEMARDLAALTGGVSLVDTNDAAAGIDRAVRDASSHYVLSYEPQTPPKGSEFRRIDVRVRRPGVRVLARRGYQAFASRPQPPMSVAGSLSPQLRALLAGVMPGGGLAMRVQAVPLSRARDKTTVAVIVEVNGTSLAAQPTEHPLRLEQGLLTINPAGKASNGTRRIFDVSLSAVQREVLAATALRSVWAIDLTPGRHQLRVGSIDVATGRGGSVYLDVDVPRDDAGMRPGVLVASRILSMMPTVFADQRVAAWTVPMPTTTRVFPAGDVLTITVPHAVEGKVVARLETPLGEAVWTGSAAPVAKVPAMQVVVPLDGLTAPVCDLVIDGPAGSVRTRIGIVSPPAAKQ